MVLSLSNGTIIVSHNAEILFSVGIDRESERDPKDIFVRISHVFHVLVRYKSKPLHDGHRVRCSLT